MKRVPIGRHHAASQLSMEESAGVNGNTFKYAGDTQALREGRFNHKLWELQMGQ